MKVYLKDSWRIDLPDIEQEGVIYQLLHDAHVRNIAPCSAAGDISNHATLTHTFINKSWACKLMIQLIPHRHYRPGAGHCWAKSHEFLVVVRDAKKRGGCYSL